MKSDNKIPITEALRWMVRLAATDGIITPAERRILSDFAKAYDLDAKKIIRQAYGFTKDVDLPEVDLVDPNEMKGRLFEQFVVSLLDSDCRLLAWRSDKIVGNTYAAENLYPDLKIRHKLNNNEVEYLVECKFRSSWGDDGIDISEHLSRYCLHAKELGLELFIALGVGGSPYDPDELFIIPAQMLKFGKRIDRNRFIKCICGKTSSDYHNLIDHYYETGMRTVESKER